MKKIITIALVVALALALVACGTTPTPVVDTEKPAVVDTEKPATVEPPADEKIVVGYAQLGHESAWRIGCTESVKAAVAEAGWELQFVDADQKQEEQIKALRDFITMGVDYIAFSPVVETGWDEVMKEIKDAGIPVFMLDRNIKMLDASGKEIQEDYYETFFGANFIEEGNKAGKWLIDYMEKEGRGNDEINIVELQGTVGSSPANDRMKGFADTIAAKSNFKITQTQTANFETEPGKTVMESFLKKGERIDVLFAHNDNMALGAIQAIEEAGKVPGKDIIIIGVDAIKDAFQEIIDGRMNVTVECTPLLGPDLVQAIKDYMDGKELPKVRNPVEDIFDEYLYKNTKSNIDKRVY